MSDNLSLIIDYINNNFRFGGRLNIDKIYDLINEYPISNIEEKLVWKELDSLNIRVIDYSLSFKEIFSTLREIINSNREINEIDLLNWFKKEKINSETKTQIRQILKSSGYTIVVNRDSEKINKDFDFLDDLDSENLDDILSSESFKKEKSGLRDVIDKKYNLEYLSNYQSNDKNSQNQMEALDNLVRANKRLVSKVAMRYKKFSTSSFDFNDMCQIGVEGLIKAAKKFDLSRENQFSTYAVYWIKQQIIRGINNFGNTIRLPVHMIEKINKYTLVENEFWRENGRLGSSEELAELLGISTKELYDLKKYRNLFNVMSLEKPINNDGDSVLIEFIPDNNNYCSPEIYVDKEELKSEIKALFKEQLSDKESKILDLRFGITDGKKYTLEEIGKIQRISRERVRQIQNKAIKKLQNPIVLERLENFYYDKR
ncbi:sigma-70 family RNA polymerase sigma factor [Bombilactobacillus bombi]|uniref:sigma-70 family RNA polymerase sigma factor n=1 Tax=Bombilactobacillus bombi TaxID=1303590 RepID=UPI000E58E6FF|nr:RNA polymerase sigma factor RpoD/SigA [Bombilactobacillus bombi]AXX64249.1 sigma-70 family RNA polymerase sigma factor [Bombilactobacillus bombi]